ncbi:MAG TPA: succinate dehydrogenase, hydrophobic membrane anchor protein [Gammaproteobacteria bacterium]|nr:succinate dehydrogenase, hydrophobic membrane anchor protein [Gammaproteobacteria bacterium]
MSRAAQGLRAWLLQRFTAIYLAVYLVTVLTVVALGDPLTFQDWRSWLGGPWMGVTTALFALALLLHAWVGVRDVLIDYVHAVWLRLLFMAITALLLLGSLLWILRALALAATGSSV